MTLKGLPAAAGFARGRVVRLRRESVEISDAPIPPGDIEAESRRFFAGREAYAQHLNGLLAESRKRGDTEEAGVLDGHIELLLDSELETDILSSIRDGLHVAEKAAELVFDGIISDMGSLEDQYARERIADFQDLKSKLICSIAGKQFGAGVHLKEPAVLVGYDLSPSDTAGLDKSMLLGIISETGGVTSHVAIISQSLGIPAVVSAKGATAILDNGDDVLIDGCEGVVIKEPSPAEVDRHVQKVEKFNEELKLLDLFRDVEALTPDGVHIKLYANAGNDQDVDAALRQNAEGIGLFRTEFLFMERTSFPTEEDQFKVYRKVAEKMNGRNVTIRTLDIGGDKPLPYFPIPREENPFLGWRAVRIYREHPEIIRTQLRAILRASHFGSLKVMFPMIISPVETAELMKTMQEIKDELRGKGIPFDSSIETGIMVETPAAVMMADELIQIVDFFSIGSNDLTQYTLAVDRGNEKIAFLYDHLHPAVMRQIKKVVDASHAHGKCTSVCGELAGDERATALLLGMGVDGFSMSPKKIQRIKKLILQTSTEEARRELQRAGCS